jgi:hypothetical protein
MALTHGYAQQANGDLNTSNDIECPLDATLSKPVVGLKSKGEAKHVLED